MEKVSIVRCNDYDYKNVYNALKSSIDNLGGISKYIKPGMKVLLKCNLLMKKKPEEAATTHPEVAAAAACLVSEAGAHPIIGDSPGGLFTERALRGVYRVCGMEEISKRDGIPLNYNTEITDVSNPEGKIVKKLTVIKLLEEVDAVISIAKLKTHGMALYTGAVKNLFGIIPGVTKAEYHFRMKKIEDFTDMLIDICTYVKPVLSIMDAVVGMEGHGPSAGDPRKIGAILASASPFALDVVSTSLVSIPPDKVYTIKQAKDRAICSSSLQDINIVGDAFDDLVIKDFKVPQLKGVSFTKHFINSDNRFTEFINYYLGPRPVFIHDKCVGCRDCEKNCPARAIAMEYNRPVVNLKECIRCYCCQELCPQKAVQIKRNIFFRNLK